MLVRCVSHCLCLVSAVCTTGALHTQRTCPTFTSRLTWAMSSGMWLGSSASPSQRSQKRSSTTRATSFGSGELTTRDSNTQSTCNECLCMCVRTPIFVCIAGTQVGTGILYTPTACMQQQGICTTSYYDESTVIIFIHYLNDFSVICTCVCACIHGLYCMHMNACPWAASMHACRISAKIANWTSNNIIPLDLSTVQKMQIHHKFK